MFNLVLNTLVLNTHWYLVDILRKIRTEHQMIFIIFKPYINWIQPISNLLTKDMVYWSYVTAETYKDKSAHVTSKLAPAWKFIHILLISSLIYLYNHVLRRECALIKKSFVIWTLVEHGHWPSIKLLEINKFFLSRTGTFCQCVYSQD